MDLYRLARPLIFTMDAERAHRMSIGLLRFSRIAKKAEDRRLEMSLAGLVFPNPVGLAAGYDKNADVTDGLLGLGFGFIEVGTLTPKSQEGNPRPRLFRLKEDRAVINRMGFNNCGQEDAHARLSRRDRRGIVGVNIGANKESTDRFADYAKGIARMKDVADYLTVNISSPNTPGLRALQDRSALDDLLAGVMEARGLSGPPIFLKVAPDLEPAEIENIADVSIAHGVNALIVSNTTISRPPLKSAHANESGGLSGAPLRALALRRLRDFRKASQAMIPLIGVGGIESGEDAYARIRAGASLVQLYSALVYEGPGLARRLATELGQLLERDGFASIAEAVGMENCA